MGKAAMSDPKVVVEQFCVLSERVWMDHDLYCSLRETDARDLQLYDRIAPLFFRDVNDILIDHLFVAFVKLTDPAHTGKHANLTANFIVEELDWPDEVRAKLSDANAKLMDFRKTIEGARNKRLAHVDLAAQLNQLTALGGFAAGADRKFLEDLQAFVDIAHGHLFDAPRPIHPAGATDTHQLLRALRKSELYNACPNCDEQQRVAALLDVEKPI
jgi:hypothetical protein